MIERAALAGLRARLREPRRFLQVVAGPRQVGKTTMVAQALAQLAGVPPAVIKAARKHLARLESQALDATPQLDLFALGSEAPCDEAMRIGFFSA